MALPLESGAGVANRVSVRMPSVTPGGGGSALAVCRRSHLLMLRLVILAQATQQLQRRVCHCRSLVAQRAQHERHQARPVVEALRQAQQPVGQHVQERQPHLHTHAPDGRRRESTRPPCTAPEPALP